MNPRLLVLGGLPEKETVNLNLEIGESFVFGRSPECDLPVASVAVSRRHCRISLFDDGFRLEDLESHNGTFVNDLPINSCFLKHGDRINIGNLSLMFLTSEENTTPLADAEFDDSLITNSSVRFSNQIDTAEFSSDLNILVKLGKAINELGETRSLQQRFLEIILEIIPARRGVIVLTDEDLTELQSVCVPAEETSKNGPVRISRTVCRQVINDESALLSNDLSDSSLSAAESLAAARVSSLLCVPLKAGERKGVIYLDSNNPDFHFTKSHLEQMTAISFVVSAALSNIESIDNLRHENELLRADLKIETDIIGESEAIRRVFYLISKVAPTEATVFIGGESGTGKEMAAKAIHQNSLRRAKPFAAINCAVLSENLLESELFGYEKGAFTGAVNQKKGKFEMADGGTIFLDEIGDLAPQLQAKLLRVLQEREFERVGGTRTIKVNVRVIAATNRNLEEEVKKGVFRQDLFFRLNVINIKMPALRERKSDIPLLAQHFIRKYSEKCNRKVFGLSEKARKILMNYNWSGNVRELENVIERAVILGTTEIILPEDLPREIYDSVEIERSADGSFNEQVKLAKQKIVREAIEEADGNYTKAANLLGLHPNNLHRLIRNLEKNN